LNFGIKYDKKATGFLKRNSSELIIQDYSGYLKEET